MIAGFLPVAVRGDSGGVEGTVQYRGEAVAGAYVELFDARDPGGDAVGAANTGSRGLFRIPLPPGSYSLTVKKRPEGTGSGGMLAGSVPGDPVRVADGFVDVGTLHLRDMGAGEGFYGQTPVSGTVHGPDGPLAGAYVYFYPAGVRRGPGYLARSRTRDNGTFTAGLAPGSYTVTARFGTSGDGMGTVQVRDLIGFHPQNPVRIGGGPVELGRIDLRPVDPEAWEERRWSGTGGGYVVAGRILREDGAPLKGAYVFLYDDRRMVGKPVSISAPTSSDGRYRVTVSRPGEYYVGARTRYGGPVEPGEYMGSWEEGGPQPVVLGGEAAAATCDIVVREVW